MGSSLSAEPDQDSPSHPGEKVVLSSELEDCTVAALMDACQFYLRSMIPPHFIPALKAHEVVDTAEHCFTTKQVLDGKKLQAAGLGSPDGKEQDKVVQWQTVEFLPDKAMIHTKSFVPVLSGGVWVSEANDEKVHYETFTRFCVDPVCVEYWWVIGGERVTSAELARMLSYILPQIHTLAKKRLVPCKLDASIAEPGFVSVVSEPMEEHITWDKMWELIRDVETVYKPIFKPHVPVVTQIADDEFTVVPETEDGAEPPFSVRVKFDKEAGEMTSTRKNRGSSTEETSHQVLHRDPLRVEFWLVDDQNQRKADKFMAAILAECLETWINRANSWF